MRVGVPKEIKDNEFRVGLTPASVRELVRHGHSTLVETLAGEGVGFSDEDYRAAGASVVQMADEVFAEADLIVKVKKPQAGAGILLGGVPGVPRAKVIILGGGVSGSNAARMAVGLEADVTVIDKS